MNKTDEVNFFRKKKKKKKNNANKLSPISGCKVSTTIASVWVITPRGCDPSSVFLAKQIVVAVVRDLSVT